MCESCAKRNSCTYCPAEWKGRHASSADCTACTSGDHHVRTEHASWLDHPAGTHFQRCTPPGTRRGTTMPDLQQHQVFKAPRTGRGDGPLCHGLANFFTDASGRLLEQCQRITASQALQHLVLSKHLLPDACPKKFAIRTGPSAALLPGLGHTMTC